MRRPDLIDEVKDVRDVAMAMRLYAKLAKNRDLEADAYVACAWRDDCAAEGNGRARKTGAEDALRSLPADWRDRRSIGHGTGALESALATHKDVRCRYLITASRTKNAGRHGEAEGVGGLEVHDEPELDRSQHR